MKEVWYKGNVMVSFGIGSKVSEGLVKFYVYGVICECIFFVFFLFVYCEIGL